MFCSLRVADEVPHDHEVAGELHGLDAVDLAVAGALRSRRWSCAAGRGDRRCAIAVSQALAADPRGRPARSSSSSVMPSGTGNAGNGFVDLVQLRGCSARGTAWCACRLRRCPAKSRVHLVGGLDVELLRVELEALGVVHRCRRSARRAGSRARGCRRSSM